MNGKQPVALITGASSGIGKETAKTLLEAGYIVYTAARRLEKMSDLQTLGAIPLKMDITVEADVAAVAERIARDHHGVDVLINNAGFGLYGAMEDIDLTDARYQFEVNLFGLAHITQLVLPYMRAQQHGKIVNISSVGGKVYTPLGAWYHATKHALEGWSDCLRIELKPFGIDVVIIEPGLIRTEFGDVMSRPILKHSGEGAYSDMAQAVVAATRQRYDGPNAGSPPAVIAKTILQAITANRPRTRYPVGQMARQLILMRKYLGDRLFDKALKAMMN